MNRERTYGYAAFGVICIVWGTTYLAIRVAVSTIPPLLLTSARYVAAGVIIFAVACFRGERIPRDGRTLRELAIVGSLLVGVGNLAVVWAEQWVPSGIAALLVATAPFWVVVLELFRADGERVDLRRGIGMLIGFAGVAMLVTPGGAGGAFDRQFVLGALVIQLGCVGWQYGTLRGKYNLKHVPTVMSSALQMLIGGVVVGVCGVAAGELPRFHVTPRTFAALAYLSLFGSVLAYTAYNVAMKSLRTTTMSLYSYVNPVVAVILGWLILHEQLTWVSIMAMIVILAGMALVQVSRRADAKRVTLSGATTRVRA